MSSSRSPPSSSHTPQIKYDVFISFRGSDTRRGFLSHLVKELKRKGVEAYIDYKLQEGSELKPALFTAIEESQIALVIFSEDYASSRWCLEELSKINECRMKNGQIVVPIFYNVDPSDVRNQRGCYEKVFAEHEESMDNIADIEKWRANLKKVSNTSGFHSKNYGTDVDLIEVVVQRVLARLDQMHQVDLKGLIGINKPIGDLQSLISCDESEDVRVIGIWGMGGIGKTTIAGALYDILCSEFEVSYFLPRVTEESKNYGVTKLRDKLLSVLLEEKDLSISVVNGKLPPHVLRRLHRKKILVVLDDINKSNQIIELVGGHSWLGQGSRIIVTTRNKHVINKEADDIYEVKALELNESVQLLNLHASKENSLQMNWDSLMLKVAEYTKGNPLALEVLGKFLNDKNAEEWEDQLLKLQNMPFPEIQDVLKLSYDGLDRKDQEIFLYIACFFEEHHTKEDIKTSMDACGYQATVGLKTLQDRALITISSVLEYVSMHDLIREMGREIVREQDIKYPGNRSHLWDLNEITHVVNHNEGNPRIESITLNLSATIDLSFSHDSFSRMSKLKFLRFHTNSYETNGRVCLPEGLSILPDEIKLFHWEKYPSRCLPTSWNAEHLIELQMPDSCVENLWDGVQNLPSLQIVNLRGSKQLIKLPDFSKASNLEEVYLEGCINLLYVHPSIFSLQKLDYVDLRLCTSLEELPDNKVLFSSAISESKLQHLNLEGCENLKHVSNNLSKLTSLEILNLSNCKELNTSNLHILFDGLSSLRHLNLGECSNLYEVPDNINNLKLLDWLSLSGSNVRKLPESIKDLSQLKCLYLNSCRGLQSLPEIPPSVMILEADDCTSLETLFIPTHQLLEQHFKFCEGVAHVFTRFRFNNCPKLDKDAVEAILAYGTCSTMRRRTRY